MHAATERLFRWTDLRKRVLSAAILAPAAMLCIWLGEVPWTAMVAVAIAVMTWEWVHLCGRHVRALPGLAVPAAVLLAAAVAVADRHMLALALLVAAFGVLTALATRRLALGVLVIGLAGIALIWLRGDNDSGRANVVFLFLVVWASDIGAYLAGRLLGGPRLAPAISPSKTWAGAVGGLAAALATGLAAAAWLQPAPAAAVLAAAGLLGIATQAGDLLESGLKRSFGVKDSGRLIPGHGGLLDRLDGLLAAAPVAAGLALLVGHGQPIWQGAAWP
jgi:phosphatidate cytidylyltransferase